MDYPALEEARERLKVQYEKLAKEENDIIIVQNMIKYLLLEIELLGCPNEK